MNVKKCDFCRKDIEGNPVVAGQGIFARPGVELCNECGAPILRFLRKHKVIGKNKKIKES